MYIITGAGRVAAACDNSKKFKLVGILICLTQPWVNNISIPLLASCPKDAYELTYMLVLIKDYVLKY